MRRRLGRMAALALIAAALPITSPISALAAGAGVVINELYYNPADGNQAEEFVELFNDGDTPVDLSDWYFSGITLTFPAAFTIEPGAFVVLRPAADAVHPAALRYSGALSNSGERIRLRNAAGTTIDDITYDDHGEWPAMADGEGDSLQRRDPSVVGTKPGNWVSAPPTPGAANALTGGLMPTFAAVGHTALPQPGEPITVTATVADAASVSLTYRVGFDSEVTVPVTIDGSAASGTIAATIPGQDAGALVRYRLDAVSPDGVPGTWPRQGDGSGYWGTTVAQPAASALPTLQWFMPDDVYHQAYDDITLSGDDGYPAVV
ncbi:MAG TPA: lamin tail domain-containing protein, partial [Ilumatobacteraceae bacterium]|nr:lamin tail domain-containing protein [Ilumatobacteraceae bacterium]